MKASWEFRWCKNDCSCNIKNKRWDKNLTGVKTIIKVIYVTSAENWAYFRHKISGKKKQKQSLVFRSTKAQSLVVQNINKSERTYNLYFRPVLASGKFYSSFLGHLEISTAAV